MATIVKKILNGVNCDIAITDNVTSISLTVSELDTKINNLKESIENSNTLPSSVRNILNNPKLKGICDAIGNVINTFYRLNIC